MKFFTKLMFLSLSLILLITSCSRDDEEQNTTTVPTSVGFVWRENANTAPENIAASADFKINTLRAYDKDSKMIFEINLMKSSAVGSYTIDGDFIKGTALYYLPGSFNATSGTLTITSNTNRKMSGTFEANGNSGNITKLYGTFTDIPIK